MALAAGKQSPAHLKNMEDSAGFARKTLEKAVGTQTVKGHSFRTGARRAVDAGKVRVGKRWGTNF